MPVTAGQNAADVRQRLQYKKGGLGRWYWDFRDDSAFQYVLGPKVLDAGCGEGITLEKIARLHNNWAIEGLDVDAENISICKSLGLPVRHGSLYELPYQNEYFDSCLLMEVIEHLEYPIKALNEISRVTRKEGRIIVVYPIDLTMYLARVVCLRFKEAAFDPGHLRQWNTNDMSKALFSTGYRDIHSISLPLPSPFALHKLVVARKAA